MPKDYVHLAKKRPPVPSRRQRSRPPASRSVSGKRTSRARGASVPPTTRRSLSLKSRVLIFLCFVTAAAVTWHTRGYWHDRILNTSHWVKARWGKHVQRSEKQLAFAHKTRTHRAGKRSAADRASADDTPRIEFEFYKMLPQNAEIHESAGKPDTEPNSTDTASETYRIHVLSSVDLKKAQAMQQRLQAHRFPARILTITRGGELVYRVQLGPYADKDKAYALHWALYKHLNLHSLVVVEEE